MKLFYRQQGRGAGVLFIHGWAMHGGVWDKVAQSLAGNYRVTCVDLPGHGRSRGAPVSADLSELTSQVLSLIAGPIVLVGWSLGALVAITAALEFPNRVTKLVLVGATPKFVQGPDWNQALPLSLLQQFATDLTADYGATLTRFLSLQIGEGPGARGLIKHLRTELFRYGEPDTDAMHSGLQLLRDTDLRSELPSVQQPVLLIHGPRDRLAPQAAAEYMATRLPHARLTSFAHAGHIPFISHTEEFTAAVEDFIHE